ncbi:MAG: chemotaxis response regulator CheY [Pseudohongiellaceae bacterium]|nr:response regulator [Paracoccaceae bacterium]
MPASLDMKILVVDDHESMRKIEKQILNDLGYKNVDMADDGTTALPMLQKGNYDFVISDWNMPQMEGIDLLKAIRADERIGKTPVLLVTAESKKEKIIEAAQAGVNDYVVKPFNADILSEKISRIFP